MKLYFSTGFDGFVYKKYKTLFDEKFVGEQGLLKILERESGMGGTYVTQKEREALYFKALAGFLKDNKDTFISASFEKDQVGVAVELLRWSDELKLMNCNFIKGVSERLDLISELEIYAELPSGSSDRWLNVLRALEYREKINISNILVFDKIELMHPLFRRLFGLLQEKGVNVTEMEPELPDEITKLSEYEKMSVLGSDDSGISNLSKIKEIVVNGGSDVKLNAGDNSFQIIRFNDEQEAADFLTNQIHAGRSDDTVIINVRNNLLNDAMTGYKMPSSGAQITVANTPYVQLFKLIPALLFKTVDPGKLISLFSLPFLPFLPFPKTLTNKLKKVLINNGGIENEDWFNAINEFSRKYDTGEKGSNIAGKIDLYFGREKTDKVTVDEINEVYNDISARAIIQMNYTDNDNIKQQLSELAGLSSLLVSYVSSLGKEAYTSPELEKIISKVYEPVSVTVSDKEKGSAPVVKAGTNLFDAPDTVIWFDFYNTTLAAGYGDFLLKKEIEILRNKEDAFWWPRGKQIEKQIFDMRKGILQAGKKLVLFVAGKSGGTKTGEHPLYSNMLSAIENLADVTFDFDVNEFPYEKLGWKRPGLEKATLKELPQPSPYVNIRNEHLLKEREKESYSSMSTLIQYPYEWVLKYMAHVEDTGIESSSELFTLKGNLSHLVVQILFEKIKNGELVVENIDVDEEIDELLAELMPEYALSFSLPENKMEYTAFVSGLKTSVKVLFDIVESNGLTFKESEYVVSGTIDSINIEGRVDMLFMKDDIPVIIDLKWTYSDKKYRKILEEEKALQLALYAKLTGDNAITGYFLLSHGKLLTVDDRLSGNAIVQVRTDDHLNMNDRIIKKAVNSYRYRWEELKGGKIELAEDMPMSLIEYASDTESRNLLPLDEDKNKKKPNPYSDYGVLKGIVR